jgi:metal-responsive CopG/Arc/MetJ family transcriptional regulator
MRRRVNLSLKPTLVRKFDRARGDVPRSVIVAKLVEDFVNEKSGPRGAARESDAPSVSEPLQPGRPDGETQYE